jgi:hypothetical protein
MLVPPVSSAFGLQDKEHMEPGTGLAILGSALGGAKLVEKMLGPTAEYIGGGLRNWTERRLQNVANIFTNAKEKLGDRIEEPGAIPPRVLKEVLDEGSYCDDPLTTEYFGGVLASSRSQVGRDDRGAHWSSLVARLSAYQVRSHFLIYRAVCDRFAGKDFQFNMDDRPKLSILLPFSSYFRSMDFSQDEMNQVTSLLNHSFFGLHKEGLIGTFLYGNGETLKKRKGADFSPPEEGGVWVTPSALGAELFLWAHGQGHLPPSALFHQVFAVPEGVAPCAAVLNEDDLKTKKSEQGAPGDAPNAARP